MSPKKLLPLVVILAVLAALALWKRSTEVTPSLLEQVQLEAMTPADMAAEDVQRIVLYAGADPESEVVLTLESAGDWVVASHYQAPADSEEVQAFLDSMLGLQGEYRADALDAESRDPYGLNENQAFHVAAYTEGAETPAVHLLIGRAPRPGTVFMRQHDQDAVYIEATSLREEAGVFGEDLALAPQANKWLDLRIANIPASDITQLTVETPDRRWVFDREIVTLPAADEEAAGEDVETSDEPVVQWHVSEGGLGEHRPTGLETLLRRFTALDAADIVDPSDLSVWGLDAPAYRIVVREESGAERVREAGRPAPGGSGYMRLAGGEPTVVYELSNSRFNQLFPAASQLFHLPALELDAEAISRIEVEQPGETPLAMRYQNETWEAESPLLPLPLNAGNLNRLRTTLSDWSPADYADPDTATGDFTRTLRFWVNGVERSLHIADDARSVDGVYARLDDEAEILIMARNEVERLFPDLNAVYRRHIFGDSAAELDQMDIVYEGQNWAFRRDDADSWDLQIDGEPQQVISNSIEELYFNLTDLQGAEIRPNAYPEPVTPWESIMQVRLANATEEWVALIGPEDADGLYPVRVNGQSFDLPLTAMDYNRIVDQLQELLAMAEAVDEGEVTLEELEAEAEAEASEGNAMTPQGMGMPGMPEGMQMMPGGAGGGMPMMPEGVQGAPQGMAPPQQQPMPQPLPEDIELPEGVELTPPPATNGAEGEAPIIIEP